MKYSFVIIAYNEEQNINQCITSILELEGIGNSYEILVMDDGSSDMTPAIVKKLTDSNTKIRLITDHINHGRGYGRHYGVDASSGDYIAMVDADIVLPLEWLKVCLASIKEYDVVGGIAVPDGDVAYIHRKFNLMPKIINGSTTITGNNGLYRSSIFKDVNFCEKLREGEDVDFNQRSLKKGFLSFRIPGLTVNHQEKKTFQQSMAWLYQSGIGATRQLIRFKQIRLPDIAFILSMMALVFGVVVTSITHSIIGLIPFVLFIILVGYLHLKNKFYLKNAPIYVLIQALLCNTLLIASYFLGRIVGFLVYAAARK